MKENIKIRLAALSMAALSLCSCGDFLEEVDQDKLIPSETDHYASVLLGLNQYNLPIMTDIEYMTDNVTEYSYEDESSRKKMKPVYTWQIEIERDEDGNSVSGNALWQNAYKDIATINYVVDFCKDAKGSDAEKAYILGEGQFLRAYCYFNLLNAYGQPYDASTASVKAGVPLRLDNGVEQTYDRNTVAECYNQIETDLKDALQNITESGLTKSAYHPGIGACQLLLSRTYLYEEKWQEAADAATEAMRYGTLTRIPSSTSTCFLTEDSKERIWSGMFYAGSLSQSGFDYGYEVNPSLISLYGTGDRRLAYFFQRSSSRLGASYVSKKATTGYTSVGQVCFRIAEAYLNRAEAYVHLGKLSEARDDMNALLATRYDNSSQYTIPSESADLLTFILNERRKELCFEEHHRWFDLRRMKDQAPTIVHSFTLTDEAGNVTGTQSYTLYPSDLNYSLPIPLDERENNPLIENNERYDKLPETKDDIVIN